MKVLMMNVLRVNVGHQASGLGLDAIYFAALEMTVPEDPENAVTVIKRFITYITIIWFCLLAIVLMAVSQLMRVPVRW